MRSLPSRHTPASNPFTKIVRKRFQLDHDGSSAAYDVSLSRGSVKLRLPKVSRVLGAAEEKPESVAPLRRRQMGDYQREARGPGGLHPLVLLTVEGQDDRDLIVR
jgi:hypothetical protein